MIPALLDLGRAVLLVGGVITIVYGLFIAWGVLCEALAVDPDEGER